MTTNARYTLFLNPDTEIVEGTFEELVRAMDERPRVGLAGVKQLTPDGELFPTIRRFPSPMRSLGEALLSERWPRKFAWAGERELDLSLYERELVIDWTSGSFMLVRTETLYAAGLMDERSFLYGEEPDLCLRIRNAGWEVRHLPFMTIVHHAGKAGISARIEAQNAFARRHHAKKHFSGPRRTAFIAANALRYGLRAAAPSRNGQGAQRRAASVAALKTLLGASEPPYEPVPPTAVRERPPSAER
jgi:GT2 family glycosyltransferase